MIKISDEVRAKIQNRRAITHAKIVIDDRVFGYDDRDKSIAPYDDGSIHKLEIESDLSKDEFAIGTACMQCCDVTLYGAEDFEFENKLLKVYIGYELNETYTVGNTAYPEIEWLPMGTYFARDIVKKGSWVSFTGYDRMYRLTDMIYVPSASLGSKPYVHNVFLDIFKFTGDSYDAASFAGMMTAVVDMKQLYGTEKDGSTTGYSVRDAMKFLSGKVGGCVIVNRNDKFEFVEFSFAKINNSDENGALTESEYLITNSDVADFEVMGDGVHGMRYIDAANAGAVIRYDNGSSQYKNGIVLDSPIISTQNEAKAILNRINSIYNSHGGVFYMTPCSFNLMNGDVSLDIGDIIAYQPDSSSEKAYIPIMHLKVNYTGKPQIEITAYNQTEVEQTNRTGPLSRTFTAFKRASDNQYKYLDEALTLVSNQITGANGGYVVVDKNEDGTWRQIRVLDSIENPKTAIVINKNGIGFSQDGGETMSSAAITIDGRIVANSMTGGILQAARGYIGNWIINDEKIFQRVKVGTTTYEFTLKADNSSSQTKKAIYANTFTNNRNSDSGDADYYKTENFYVRRNGEVMFQDGVIAGWNISEDGFSKDDGDYRTYMGSPNNADRWVFSVQKKESNGEYYGKFFITAEGQLHCYNNIVLPNSNSVIKASNGTEILNPYRDGELVIGQGYYEGNYRTDIKGGIVKIQPKNALFTFSNTSWDFEAGIGGRNTINSAGGFVLSANDGNNAMYMVGNSIYLYGNAYLNFKTVSGTVPLVVNSKGLITTTSSSQRYKENITEELEDWLNPEKLYDLSVVQYNYKDDYKDIELVAGTQIGITAEDVHKYYPNACIYNEKGEPESWQDRIMIPAMLKLIQEQKKEIDSLNERLTVLENSIKNRAD